MLRTLLPGTNLKGVKIEGTGNGKRPEPSASAGLRPAEPGTGAGKGSHGVVAGLSRGSRQNVGLVVVAQKKGETPGFEPGVPRCSD